MAAAGADVVIAHMGTTVGGTIGAETAFTLEDAAVRVQEICDAAKAQNPDVLCMSHGGPISKAPEAAFINEKTDTVGFVGASSIERFACEESIPRVTASFKA